MLYKKASEMKPTPIPHCMGGEGTVMMERLLDAPAEMLGKGRAYVRHTLAPGVTIGRHTHEHEMESMVIVSGRAVHIINGEEQILEKGDIIAAMPDIAAHVGQCRFANCKHLKEPSCSVKEAVEKGLISKSRYDFYCAMAEQLEKTPAW